jgi:hypothetical protein
MVWLTLIPIFGVVWQFIIVGNIADTLKAEFAQRNINVGEDRPGYNIGLIFCILMVCTIVPFVGFLTGVGALVCWIIYWVKISEFRSTLRMSSFHNPGC